MSADDERKEACGVVIDMEEAEVDIKYVLPRMHNGICGVIPVINIAPEPKILWRPISDMAHEFIARFRFS